MKSSFILAAFVLDLVLGDPRWVPHPVRMIGKQIDFLEKMLRRGDKPGSLKLRGAILFGIVVFSTLFCTFFILEIAKTVGIWAEFTLSTIFSYFTLSTRDLYSHGIRIYRALETEDIEGAKFYLSMIVSRDVTHMDRDEIVRSSVESISENTCDGALAPIFYLFLGGPILAMVYKAVNTLDSMVGYKNEKYLHFGFFSAKMDDLFNFLPARISAFLISFGSLLYFRSPGPFFSSLKTILNEARNHPSPNSGWPESAMAGALGIRVSGPQYYGGKLYMKPYIGMDIREISPARIKEALHIMLLASFLMVLGGVFVFAI